MQAILLSQAPLLLPSASGIEIVGNIAYVIGDDSAYLYAFRVADLQPGEPIRLFESTHFSGGRIPKPEKPDLEALTLVRDPATGRRALVALGSGSLPTRLRGFWIDIADDDRPGAVYPLDLAPLYQLLRPHLRAGETLNLEAAAATDEALLLTQRAIGPTGGSWVFRLPLRDALDVLRGRPGTAPTVTVTAARLPGLGGRPAGLSGAAWFEGRLLVTASVEDTLDAVHDGAVLGSLVGVLDLERPARSTFAVLTWPDGRAFREKVEGLAVRTRRPDGTLELLLVTDDDAGGSTVVVAHVVLP